jgi:5-deoxy-5-amino-3-dehydroquinate synthase
MNSSGTHVASPNASTDPSALRVTERHVVLVGMMGSGKSTVGRLLASRLHRRFVDTDVMIEDRSGRTVREIFSADGETGFRRLELDVLGEILAGGEPVVVAAGGGAVVLEEARALLRSDRVRVIWLEAPAEELARRVAGDTARPLLDGDPLGRLIELRDERDALYRSVADRIVPTAGRSPDELVDEIAGEFAGDPAGDPLVTAPGVPPGCVRVEVPVGERTYGVLVGHGALAGLGHLVPAGVRRAVVVTQAGVPRQFHADVAFDPGVPFEVVEIGIGEEHKSLTTIESLCRAFAAAGLTRNDLVIGVGGGLVTDVAGFAASVWHRGTRVVHVATTLLGMVDAAIGGKTGVNLPDGKNLVGAFWQPSGVVCDLDALGSLPAREMRCGLGEMAKYHFLTGEDLEALPLAERVARCVGIKAEVVAGDERELGRRALLNYGHTLGHAVEIATAFRLAHGEAVAVGLVFAAHLAAQLGRVDGARVADHVRVVGDVYGLSWQLPEGLEDDELVALMGRDKKAIDGLTFILDGPTGVEAVHHVPERAVRAALDTFRAASTV